MKILFLSAWYPHKYDPMPGLFVKQHAAALASNHEIAVLYTHAGDDKDWIIVSRREEQVLTTIVYYPKSPKNPFQNNICMKGFKFLKAHFIGYRQIQVEFGKPQLVHVNILSRCGIPALLLLIFHKIPYVITEHWSRYLSSRNDYHGWLRKKLTRITVRKSLGICTVSETLKKAMIQQGLSHPHFGVIHNSVDTQVFVPAGQAVKNNKFRMNHISCFDDAAKNISGILRTINHLKEKRSDFSLYLTGDGPDMPYLKLLSDELGLTDKFVFFTGLLEGAALVAAYQQGQVTILFSNYENMPVVIAESFACGIPVIATAVGGIPEVVNNQNGLLVPIGDENALMLAIEDMLDHSVRYDQKYIRDFAVEKFGRDGFIRRYEEFYNGALHRSGIISPERAKATV